MQLRVRVSLRNLAAVLLGTFFFCSVAEAAIVTINANSLTTSVRDNGNPVDSDYFTGTAIPSSVLLQSNGASPDQFAKAVVTYSDSGSQVILDHHFDFSRQGGQGDLSQLYNDSLYFTANANTAFNASGIFTVDDIGATSGATSMWVYLYDTTASSYVFYSLNYSKNTTDESFVLGVSGGDTSSNNFGSLSGALTAGHTYRYFFSIYTFGDPDADSGTTATGFINLTIGTAPVPEPASCVIWGALGIAGLVAAQRRKKLAA
jgi:hypothetical protein